MSEGLPFPVGRFTEREWYVAYRFILDEEDARREARYNAGVTQPGTDTIDIMETDLALLSLVSDDVAARVDDYRREIYSMLALMDNAEVMAARETHWEELRSHLRRTFGA
jgi:hypothetical protein